MSVPFLPSSPLPRPRAVAWSAFRAGSLSSLLLRPGRSGAAVVLVCWFRCPRRAGRFAARWAARLGRSVRVSGSVAGWAVSVPVGVLSSRPACAGGLVLWVAGRGVRGFARLVASSGLRVCR